MERAESKIRAKELLSGRWGNAVGAVVIFFVIAALASIILYIIPILGWILGAILSYYLNLAFNKYCIMLTKTDEKVKYNDCFVSGSVLIKAAVAQFIVGLILAIIPLIIFAIGGVSQSSTIAIIGMIIEFIISIYYILTFFTIPFIFIEDEDIGIIDGIKKAIAISRGFKWKYFIFLLSFIGWSILATITLGIGWLWLKPYMTLSTYLFYKHMVGEYK
ncbi:DUF975 family protein [Clostridium perfringens]|nr:DUF975 family protein [Clostridium perfringens]